MSAEQIKGLFKAGILNSTSTMVWREGLSDWKPLAESGLLEEIETNTPVAADSSFTNPYLSTKTTRNAFETERAYVPLEYPGYGRLRYFLTLLILTFVFYAILIAAIFAMFSSKNGMGGGSAGVIVIIFLLMFGGSIYVGLQRLKNLGMSGWALLWSLVPIMNLWIGWRMLACPAGYEEHRQLDTAAKVITAIWIGFVVLSIIVNIFAVID